MDEWWTSFLVNFIIIQVFFFCKNYIKVSSARKQVDSIAENLFVWCKFWTEKAAPRVGWISTGNLKMNLVVCTFLMLNSPQRAIKFSAWCSLSSGMVPQKLATFRKLTATEWSKRSEEKRSGKNCGAESGRTLRQKKPAINCQCKKCDSNLCWLCQYLGTELF